MRLVVVVLIVGGRVGGRRGKGRSHVGGARVEVVGCQIALAGRDVSERI